MLEVVVVLSINLVSILLHDFNIGGHVNGMLSQFLLFLLGEWNSCFLYSLDFFFIWIHLNLNSTSHLNLYFMAQCCMLWWAVFAVWQTDVKFNSLYYGLLLIINLYILACVNPSILLIKECLFLSFKDAERAYLSIRATKLKDVDRI